MGSGPEGGGGRIEFLDVLRGVAILGILPVNAAYFAYPSTLVETPGYPEGGGAAGTPASVGVAALFEWKFISLFSLLFGVGMALLRRNAAAERGARWGPLIGRRLGTLWLLGCAHAVLLWYGDIVAYYALLGLALWWAPGRSPGALRGGALALLALPLALYLAVLGGLLADLGGAGRLLEGAMAATAPDGRHPGWEPGGWEGFGSQLAEFDPDFEIAVYRDGSLAEAVVLRSVTWMLGGLFAFPIWVPRIAGLMLLGMAWAGEGWFLAPASEEGRRRFGLLLRRGIAIGAPFTAAAQAFAVLDPADPASAVASEILQYVGSLGLAAAFAALVARACGALPGAAAIRALAAVGRTAFSNYILQSVAMTVLFYGTTVLLGAGFGLFAGVGRVGLLGIAAAVAAAQVAASVLWLRVFSMGPLEWAWRAATCLRFPPLLRRSGPPG